jgi:predicted regulator of Ras-like GTPase activity (Roadblock/LC7/MglB family)
MAEEVQRALDNLRFDRMVKAFCVISPDNEIYQSTLDSDTEAMVKQTVSLYKGQISQLTVNTEAGLVVISKIAENWLLAVLFPPNLSLGIAVVKTKATLLALRELDLNIIATIPATIPQRKPTSPPTPAIPPPVPSPQPTPKPTPQSRAEAQAEPISKPPSTEPIPPPIPKPVHPEVEAMPPPIEPPPPEPDEATTPPSPLPPSPAEGLVDLTFIPQGGEDLLAALDTGSPVGSTLHDKFGPYARDVLFLVDGKRDVKTIAFLLGLPEYAIVEVLEFAINNRILASPAAA